MTAQQSPHGLMRDIGGLPFASPGFRATPLLTLAASARRKADPIAFPQLVDYLDPVNAAEIFARHARDTPEEIPWTPLSPEQEAEVAATMERIVKAMPEWKPLFSIPTRFRRMEGEYVSSTSALIPQTVFLGDVAFTPAYPLEETLVHEYAHIWMNFIAEIADLQMESALENYTLPSGTGGKSLRGVLLAAHFAAAAVTFYLRSGIGGPRAEERMRYLLDYLDGCNKSTADDAHLTVMGQAVNGELASWAKSLRCEADEKFPIS
ncbi:aKG-HExxH-type peptide beta-hydroxylase [Streptomyces sp. NPDC012600]|uniref:aKG-HExxH-type peptide beta-hydroxylase n=1 Tax=Streptomyces sp. NPDC012600 TaxID=3415005 RepID=UPI003C2DF3BA